MRHSRLGDRGPSLRRSLAQAHWARTRDAVSPDALGPARPGAAGRGWFAAAGRLPGRANTEAQALARLPDCDIAGALHDLPDDLALAVWLADVEGLRYREIADVLGMPVATVAARLHRGRRRLRDRLAVSAARRGLAPAPG